MFIVPDRESFFSIHCYYFELYAQNMYLICMVNAIFWNVILIFVSNACVDTYKLAYFKSSNMKFSWGRKRLLFIMIYT